MPAELKADFARRRKVNRATVTKWAAQGLLVLTPAGLVDVEATEWNLDQRPETYRGGRTHRPIRSAPEKAVDPREKPIRNREPPAEELDLRDVLVAMIHRVEAVVAFAVLAAEGSLETAFAAVGVARMEMVDAASDLALTLGAPDGCDGPLGVIGQTDFPPDWAALADLAGHPLNLDAWREAERRLPYWADVEPHEAPHPWNTDRS